MKTKQTMFNARKKKKKFDFGIRFRLLENSLILKMFVFVLMSVRVDEGYPKQGLRLPTN